MGDFELVNLRSDLTGDSSYDYHAVRYWSAPDGQAGNEHGIVVAASNDFDVHWSSTIDGVPDHFMGTGEDEGLSTEALVLISVGTVAGIALLAFFCTVSEEPVGVRGWAAALRSQRGAPQ